MKSRQPSLRSLCAAVKTLIRKGDASNDEAQAFYANAGANLRKIKDDPRRTGSWASYVREHCGLSQQRADELIRIAEGRTTVKKVRAEKAASVQKSKAKLKAEAKANTSSVDSPAPKPTPKPGPKLSPEERSCDFDWDNVKPEDFGDSDTAYRRQAGFYVSEALRLAEAFPLLRVTPSKITQREVQDVRKVARAWSELADTIAQHIIRKAS